MLYAQIIVAFGTLIATIIGAAFGDPYMKLSILQFLPSLTSRKNIFYHLANMANPFYIWSMVVVFYGIQRLHQQDAKFAKKSLALYLIATFFLTIMRYRLH